ncbi:Cell division trigger factor [Mycoplasmopsis meleagridis]|uniref:Cell division trigger factor n=1 Tax=Mycoplasmopsis meleagridis ATCC 25294 TaxID=1264554 RepID=A0A0F5H145_9BACT|nr:hypothetical protein [Mycoplasmopsis meleagridis]KKB26870.1 Cell division trigger factor [Mycoplasmopsis meleagridis ATCC 25294]OAD18301.1 Cell division trigger factor [Mycoplasmopsis meleagridis]VEU77526.1 Uncharacterised protein [Mycoplasmopsis meleagridis]
MNEINFHIKEINVNIARNEWKDIQKNILLEALNNKEVNDPQSLLKKAIDLSIQENIKKLRDEIINEFKDVYSVVAPNVQIHKADTENLNFDIQITFYTFEDLDKLVIENIKNDFTFKPIDEATIEAAFKTFLKNYPIFLDVKDDIKEGDIVVIAYKSELNGKIVEQKTAMTLEAKNINNDFNINSLLIGKKVGEVFEVNDPKNTHWTITIVNAQRKEVREINDQNIDLVRIDEIKSIDDLKEKLYEDYKMDYASSELLRYYRHIIFEIGKVNKVLFSVANLQYEMTQFFQTNQHLLPNDFKEKTMEELVKEKDPKFVKLMTQIENSAKFKMLTRLVEYYVSKKYKIEITPEETEKAYEHIMSTNISDQTLSLLDMSLILHTQKAALYLAKLNNLDTYEIISKEMKLFV